MQRQTHSCKTVIGFLRMAVLGVVACSEPGPAPHGARAEPISELQLGAAPANAIADVDGGAAPTDTVPIRGWLDSIYKDTDIRHSFHTKFGEAIDCVDFSAYPSVKALRARGLPVIPPGPSVSPPSPGTTNSTSLGDVSFNGEPDEDGNARSCPIGSVPATRPTLAQIQSAGGVNAFLSARASVPPPSSGQHDCLGNTTPGADYDHSGGYEYGGTISGLATALSIYPSTVEYTGDHSVSQMWIQTGNCEYDTPRGGTTCNPSGQAPVQSLEVGYIIGADPYAPGNFDTNDRLFVFVATNGYHWSCWAGLGSCDTFVPNPGIPGWPAAQFTAGQIIGNTSILPAPNQPPAELWIQVWNGGAQNPFWYVWVTTNGTWNLMGWYPSSSVFTGQMQTSATYIQAGGEVFDSWMGNPNHTGTYMGSGSLGYGFKTDAYQRNVAFIDPQNHYANAALTYNTCGWESTSYYGYNTSLAAGTYNNGAWGTYFYFGGPFGHL